MPLSNGLTVAVSVKPVLTDHIEGGLPSGTRSVSVFLVNRRTPQQEETRDEAFAFQAQLEIQAETPFVARPDLRSLESNDWDERVADLQYRDAFEFAVGHSVATEALLDDLGQCHTVRTCWIPQAEVERVAPTKLTGVELSMDALAQLADANQARQKLRAFASQYRTWIAAQRLAAPVSPAKRKETTELLLQRAEVAAKRIEQGLSKPNRNVPHLTQ